MNPSKKCSSLSAQYSGFETEDGETMSGVTADFDIDEFCEFVKEWLKNGLERNPHKIFSLVIITEPTEEEPPKCP